MQLTRRAFLSTASLTIGGALAACGPSPAPQATSAPGQPTPPPAQQAIATTGTVAKPSPAVSPAVSPVAARSPVAAGSPVVAAASPSPAAAAAARAPAAAGKPMYQQDAQHTGRSPYAGPRQASVQRRFDTSTPDNIPADAIIPRADFQSTSAIGPDGTIYIANFAGVLYALRDSPSARDRLEPVWRFHPPAASSFHATPALSADGSTVYLGFAAGAPPAPVQATLYAVKTASSGPEPQEVWRVDLGATRVMGSPTVGPDGVVYVANANGQLFAVGADGKVRWTAQTGPAIKSAVALGADGTIYQPSSDGKLYAVSPQGQVKWTFDFGEHLGQLPVMTSLTPLPGGAGGGALGIGSGASPTVGADGTVYIGSNNSNMYAVAPDGKMKWLFEAERELGGIWTTPALSVDGSTLYFGANKGGIYALRTADGTKRWQYPIYGSIYGSSALDSRGVLYTGATIEHLYAVDSNSGELVWDLDIHNQVWSAPSIRPDGTLAIADRSGVVQVIG